MMDTIHKLSLLLLMVGFSHGSPINLAGTSHGHTEILIGIATTFLVVGGVILVGCLCCQRRKGFEEEKRKEFHNNPVIATNLSSADHGLVNPMSSGEFTIFTPLHPPNNAILGNDEVMNLEGCALNSINIRPWFDNRENDFPRVKLKYIRELGNGRFGKVVEGTARDLDPRQVWTPVVVRILDAGATPRDKILFLSDTLFYLAPSHPNLLALKGRCLNSAPLLLLHEYCSGGDLKTKLRSQGSQDRILQWCCQITSAIKHLHDHSFIHPDLAARNCLLSSDLTLKLGDYALSVIKYPDDYYRGGEPPIPVRWRSPESLDCTPTTIKPLPLTKEANIWSLGVVMWEICEGGAQPYGELTDDGVISKVFGAEGLRLDGPSKPQMYSDYIFRLIKMCWNTPESRPKVIQIDMMLSDLLQVHKHTQNPLPNSDFDQRWESFKPNTIVRTDNQSEIPLKSLSSSLNNLHGSLDNLSPTDKAVPEQMDSLSDSFKHQGSSESDTEEENWKCKVERGAYSEKVRLKSRSVADLMVLTHVDYSESESETPMPSMDYKPRAKRSNLETCSLIFSSEGNLLNLENNFEQELKKLQFERRDSLLFVPDSKSETNSNISLMHELSSPTEMRPINQIYNIFNMSIDKFDPMGGSGSKLQEIINLGEDSRAFNRQDSESKSDLGYVTLHNSERNSDFGSVDGELLLDDGHSNKAEIEEKLKNCELLLKQQELSARQNLPDILASLDREHGQVNVDLLESNLPQDELNFEQKIEDNVEANNTLVLLSQPRDDVESQIVYDKDEVKLHETDTILETDKNSEEESPEGIDLNVQTVPKLSEIIQNDPELKSIMKKLPLDESQNVPDIYSENLESSHKSLSDQSSSNFTDISLPQLEQTYQKNPEICLETAKFLSEEQNYCSLTKSDERQSPKLAFDLSGSQQRTKPNPLTHNAVFASTPVGKISSLTRYSLQSHNIFGSHSNEEEDNMFSSNFLPISPLDESENLNYSLETWDNFLGKSLDSSRDNENFFDSFTSEPQSMMILPETVVDEEEVVGQTYDTPAENKTFVKENDGTFVIEENANKTFEVKDNKDGTFILEDEENANAGSWESGGGWFLHPQSHNDTLSGEIDSQPSSSKGSYVRFGTDDEAMTAIRNELLQKLPQAQGASPNSVIEEETWNPSERNEVFLKYNVYNAPLSPIPEESSMDEEELVLSEDKSPRISESNWSEEDEEQFPPPLSSNESPVKQPELTPSQSSCCSNDTLFNCDDFVVTNEKIEEQIEEEQTKVEEVSESQSNLEAFLDSERQHTSSSNKVVAPLSSPNDNPWKSFESHGLTSIDKPDSIVEALTETIYENVTEHNQTLEHEYENQTEDNLYDNISDVKYENLPNMAEESGDYVNAEDHSVTDSNEDLLGVLTDIRFSGPIDNQLMSTSFSESNEAEEQDWDSGSDTRSSSSGEFIWKEGEHEESLKALKAAPQDAIENVQPMEEITEEATETDVSTSSSDDEGENLEFVPSAWDKFATPTKSALRSPEKSLERPEKKSKGVWFKKQKYHCVYEYPREPESPVLHSQDLWKPQLDFINFTDWEFDADTCLPPPTGECDLNPSTFTYKPNLNNSRRSLYYLTNPNDMGDGSTSSKNYEDEYKPTPLGLSSQFFPGAAWLENVTPDSGLEDSTPGSDSVEYLQKLPLEVQPLKKLAANIVNKSNFGVKDTMGGLRHTRNKLKLDLPPSPSAFSTSRTFTVEPSPDPVELRQKPTFSTFGKSRFLVQHVDTPPDCDQKKNVCFDVLPYKPLQVVPFTQDKTFEPLKGDLTTSFKKDIFNKGEANVLDSADEDSGIESSTLERKCSSLVKETVSTDE